MKKLEKLVRNSYELPYLKCMCDKPSSKPIEIDPDKIEIIPPQNNTDERTDQLLQQELLIAMALLMRKNGKALRTIGYTLAGLTVFAVAHSLINSWYLTETFQKERAMMQKLCELKRKSVSESGRFEQEIKIPLPNGETITCTFKKTLTHQ